MLNNLRKFGFILIQRLVFFGVCILVIVTLSHTVISNSSISVSLSVHEILSEKRYQTQTDTLQYKFLKTVQDITPIPTPIQTLSGVKIINTREYVYYPLSKQNPIGNVQPNDLVELPRSYTTRRILVSQLIVADLIKLIEAAKQNNIELRVVAGYRSFQEQQDLFQYYKAEERQKNPLLDDAQIEILVNTYSARPGYSEHHLGTVVDILSAENNYQFDSDPKLKYVQWLENNAYKYNFRISYYKGNPEYIYEPWHIRWWP
jgi:D-alanyl-D-alanine carboxypeptidase